MLLVAIVKDVEGDESAVVAVIRAALAMTASTSHTQAFVASLIRRDAHGACSGCVWCMVVGESCGSSQPSVLFYPPSDCVSLTRHVRAAFLLVLVPQSVTSCKALWL